MNELHPRAIGLLVDIRDSALRIVNLLAGESVERFADSDNQDVQDIVARRLTIIGEAAAALMRKFPELCAEHSGIPFREARGMRNVLVHDYNGTDWETVWNTVHIELPDLIDAVDALLAGHGNE